jgi:tRNA 2-thiouridine synthesizing protein E
MAETKTVTDLIDDYGFLTDPELWDRDLALALAAQLDLKALEEDHWSVIDYVREHYLVHGTLPWNHHVCHELELEERCIYRLFGGPLELWKVAGLPDPGEEARTYMENQEP